MKRHIVLVSVLALAVSTSYGQFKYGIKAGVSSATINTQSIDFNDPANNNAPSTLKAVGSQKLGLHFGVTTEVSLLGFFVKPEAYFSTSSAEFEIQPTAAGSASSIKKQTFNKLDIPVLVGMKFGPARIGLGPVASILLQKKSDVITKGVEQNLNTATFGLQVGAGIDLLGFGLDLRYETSLSKLGDGVTIDGTKRSFDTRPSQWLISASYYF
jgi:hypothetical protein